ncbi:MAG: hypothetical protein IE922_11440 [Sphingomonadales bacterium]|nr:hypothetical protein [Sphingomonadales bacterium]
MIAAENPAKPLSDAQIAARLAAEGITISRRVTARLRARAARRRRDQPRAAFSASPEVP